MSVEEESLARRHLKPDELYCGDARELLPLISPDTLALSVWSPPYFVGKSYEAYLTSFDAWEQLLRDVVCLHYPILRPGGFLVINIADILCFADPEMPRIPAMAVSLRKSKVTLEDVVRAQKKHPNFNRYQLAALLRCSEQTIDRRLHGNNIRGGKYQLQTRIRSVAGLVEAWAQSAGLYLYDRRIWAKDPTWQNSEWHTTSYRSVDEFEYLFFLWKPGTTVVDRNRLTTREWTEWGSRGVWTFPSVRINDDHEAKFPLELPRRAIRLLTDPGDTVLDCFLGSGTTAVAAILEGRRFLGIELRKSYVELAKKNCRAIRSNGTLPRARSLYPEPAKSLFS